MKTLTFFNSIGGVGKTTLVYHLAHMVAELGETVLVVDLDPQAHATILLLEEKRLEGFWPEGEHSQTIFGALRPVLRGLGDVQPHVEPITPRLGLVVGDFALSTVEDQFSDAWTRSHAGDAFGWSVISALHRVIGNAATQFGASWVFVDLGPSLGAINRAALLAAEYLAIPVVPDLFSLQGLRNLGPTLQRWRASWRELIAMHPSDGGPPLAGRAEPLGYVVMQQGMRESRTPTAYRRWVDRFPRAYRESVLGLPNEVEPPSADSDPYCLAMLKHYRSLMPMAMEARKPVFALKPADGAIGAHVEATRNAYLDFLNLARAIAERTGTSIG